MSGPWEAPGPDPAVARLLRRDAPPPPEPSLLREPARVTVAVGALLAIVSSPLPWATETGVPRPEVRTGWSGTADGFLLAAVAVALLAVTAHRGAAEASARTVRALPLVLGLVAAALGIGALRTIDHQIAMWETGGGSGVREPWLYVAVLGGALLAAGGARVGWRALRRPVPRPEREDAALDRRTVLSVVVGIAGGIVGAGFGATAVLRAGLPPAAVGLPLIAAVLVGGAVGAVAGTRLARLLPSG